MSVIALTRNQKIGKTEGRHYNAHPTMAKLLRIGLELFACGQGIWRQIFEKCQTPPSPPYVTCDSFEAEANKWERKYDTYTWVKQKQTNKKKQRRFACNYMALVSDFIWSWYAFKNAAEVCIIRHFNKTLVELQQKLNNIKNQCLSKF